MMCWMCWFPPQAGRNPATLRPFVDRLLAHTADNPAGAGAAWLVPGALRNAVVQRALHPDLGLMVQHLVGRPAGAWGIFHARRARPGNRATKWCHPHATQRGTMRMLLTYNGVARLVRREGAALWAEAQAQFGATRVNPVLIPALVGWFGFDRCAELGLPNTTICVEEVEDADQSVWRIRAWRKLDRFPLFVLANGAVASEGGEGEFASVREVPLGMTLLGGGQDGEGDGVSEPPVDDVSAIVDDMTAPTPDDRTLATSTRSSTEERDRGSVSVASQARVRQEAAQDDADATDPDDEEVA